jgi:hypothetical protein
MGELFLLELYPLLLLVNRPLQFLLDNLKVSPRVRM